MNLNFEYKTPANFYDGLVKVDENEAALKKWGMVVIDLDSLPKDAILIRSKLMFSALEAGYYHNSSGYKNDEFYFVMVPKKEVNNDSND